MTTTLLLNASFEPLCVVPLRRAVLLVLACRPCNADKGDKTLAEVGWTLSKTPVALTRRQWLIVGYADVEPVAHRRLRRRRAGVGPVPRRLTSGCLGDSPAVPRPADGRVLCR